jgi:hypothetical protein
MLELIYKFGLILGMIAIIGGLIQAILPSKEKWEELKKQTENRRKKK